MNGSTYHNGTGAGDGNTIGVIGFFGAAHPIGPDKEGQWPVNFDVPPAVAAPAIPYRPPHLGSDNALGPRLRARRTDTSRLKGAAPLYQANITP